MTSLQTLTGAVAPGISCPELPINADIHAARLVVAYGDSYPRSRPLAIKLLASRGYAMEIPPSWPELATVQCHIDGASYALPDAQGNYLQPAEYPVPPEPATATASTTDDTEPRIAAGQTAAEFVRTVQIARVRRENAEWKRRNHVGSRKQRGVR